MHELGICNALLNMVRGIMEEDELAGVTKVTVEVGTLSGVIPRYMSECWEAVIDGTEFADTELAVEPLDGTAKCLDCGAEFTANLEKLVCPACGGRKLTPLTGRDLTIKEIEAY